MLTCRFSCEKQNLPIPGWCPLGANEPICWALLPARPCASAPFQVHIDYTIVLRFIQVSPENSHFSPPPQPPSSLKEAQQQPSPRPSLFHSSHFQYTLESTKIGEQPIWRERSVTCGSPGTSEPGRFGTEPCLGQLLMYLRSQGRKWQRRFACPWLPGSRDPTLHHQACTHHCCDK